jgi:uncharacterized membrane protein YdcZ (DUF606 family)
MTQLISSQVMDESTGQPVSNAIIYTADADGNPTAVARTDTLGAFSGNFPGDVPNVIVAAPGYAPKIVDVGSLDTDEGVTLTQATLSPGDATTSIQNTTVSRIPWYIWIGGAVVIIYAAGSSSKKKSIGDASGYILPIGIVAAIAFVLYKLGLFSGTATGTGANNAAATQTIAAGTASSLQQLAAKGVTPSLTQAQAASIANNIFNAGITVTDQSNAGVSTIFNLLAQCQNDADIYLIMQNFGTRQVSNSSWSLCSLANINCDAIDLDSFVTGILNQANVPGLGLSDLNFQLQNSELGPTGITYQF